jgi:hypothetical protein
MDIGKLHTHYAISNTMYLQKSFCASNLSAHTASLLLGDASQKNLPSPKHNDPPHATPFLDKTQNNKSAKSFADAIPEDELIPNLLFVSTTLGC